MKCSLIRSEVVGEMLSWVLAMSSMTAEEVILREYEAYEAMKAQLLERYGGRVVAVKDGRVVGVYDSEEEALKDVVERFRLEPVLIKRVVEEERLEYLPAYTYGLLTVTTG